MYFLEKEGIYGHGVFWIGDNQSDGIAEANRRADLDRDDYHLWVLKKFIHQSDDATRCDPEHEVVYQVRKQEGA